MDDQLIELTQAQETLLKLKRQIFFLSSLEDYEILSLTEDVGFLRYNKFETIFDQEESDSRIYFVISGQVILSRGSKDATSERITGFSSLVTLEKRKLFGHVSAILKQPHDHRAIANDNKTTILYFKLRRSIDDENAWSYIKVYQSVIEQLSEMLRISNATAYANKR